MKANRYSEGKLRQIFAFWSLFRIPTKRAFKDASIALLIAVLVIQMALPMAAMAAGDELVPAAGEPDIVQPGAPVVEPPVIAAAQAAVTSRGETARLELTPQQRNLYFLINQDLQNTRPGLVRRGWNWAMGATHAPRTWRLSQVDLSLPEVNVTPGTVARLLEVTPIADGVDLSLRGYNYTHRINFGTGQQVVSFTYDREYLLMHLSDGTLLGADLRLIEETLYRAPIQIVTLGKSEPIPGVDMNTVRLRFVQRRYNDPDQSRAGREAQLDSRSSTVLRIMTLADGPLLARVEANLERVRYIPLAAEIAAQHPLFDAGDLALVTGEKENERIVRVVAQTRIASDMKEHVKVGLGLSAISSPDWAEAQKEFTALRDDAAATAQRVVSTPAMREWYEGSGHREAIGRIPRTAFTAADSHSDQVVESAGTRDRFTPGEHQTDSQYLTTVVEGARVAAHENQAPRFMRRWSLWLGEKIRTADVRASFRRLGYVLAGGAAVGTVGISLDLVSAVTHWGHTAFPVWFDSNYRPTLLGSVACQMILPVLLFSAAALASPFSQFRAAVLLPLTTIRMYARYIQANPLRLFAAISGQGPALQALREGTLVRPVSVIPGESRRASVERASRTVRAAHERGASYTLALAAVSLGSRVNAGQLAVHDNGGTTETRAGQAEAIATETEITELMRSMPAEELAKLAHEHSDELLRHVRRLRGIAEPLATPAARQTWYRRMKWYVDSIVKVRVLRAMGNYTEQVRKDLGNIVPSEFVGSTVTRDYAVDYTLSLMTAVSMGDWANLSKPERLHAQRAAFLLTHPTATTENAQQTLIHMGRGAASTALTFQREQNTTNAGYRPAENVDESELQKEGTKALHRETWHFLKTLVDLRNTQPGEVAYTMIYNGRVRLFQSTLLLGVIPRLTLGGQSMEQALIGQGVFMACALWAFAWPAPSVHAAQNIHQSSITEKWTEFRGIQTQLHQAWRFRDTALAEKAVAEMETFYRKHLEFRGRELPARAEGEGIVSYAHRIHEHALEKPPVASRYSAFIAYGGTVAYGIASGFMATYFYTKTFMGNIGWTGINLTDWNLLCNLPEGDGLFALMFKSAVWLHGALTAQRLFNLGWDAAQVRRASATVEQRTARETRLAASVQGVRNLPVTRAGMAVINAVGSSCKLLLSSLGMR